ncbi:MMPL family transporter [Actinomarinicola tropica]|uniref:MMPL family transporter n=1 Tax=Actinomarinicola tropica TaxID=2789776 RepID=A0A5Q2RMQ1_9ACTN|nr:MMPL family transporter [Actinomarinicola tropica]QGG94485.1 MMPL family transporter [Actinomarinicola tropica]
MLARLGRLCFRRRRLVVVAWLALVLGVHAAGQVTGTSYDDAFNIPASESRDGFDLIDEHFGDVGNGFGGTIVFRSERGVDDPAVRRAMEEMFARAAELEGVVVSSPYDDPLGLHTSPDGTVAYAEVNLVGEVDQTRGTEIGDDLRRLAPELDGLTVEIGGAILGEFEPPNAELIGLAFAIVVLILSFGSVLAMGLPIGVALFGVATGAGIIALVSNLTSIPDLTTMLGAMIGLGVGIDYALFIVTRYREGTHHGHDPEEATLLAIDSAGRAVLFAGTTVVISLLGMLIIGLPFISGMAIGASATVAMTMAASVTLLPALLGFAQHRVEVTRWRGLIAAGFVALALLGAGIGVQPLLVGAPLAVVVLLAGVAVAPLRREVPRRPPRPVRETLPHRWSRLVQSRPWVGLLAGAAFLVVLAVPVLDLQLGFSDEGNFPTSTTTRRAYDLLAEGFGPGVNGPLVVVAEADGAGGAVGAQQVADAVAAADGVAQVFPVFPSDLAAPTDAPAFLVQVIPSTSPQDPATAALVERLRDDVIPAAAEGTGLEVRLTGAVAANIDFTEYLEGRMPWFFGAVLALSFLLLMAVFRSLLVPIKAVVMNLLSIASAYGVVVAVFQWGWFGDLFGIAGAPIEPFVPMMLFAIVFGLSMDYEVFLLSRVKEEFDRTGDPVGSVADGLAATARVITAAAAIMVVVFGSFVFEDDRIIKLFGLGLAAAVLLDASVVRMLLVPSTMALLGRRNWWLPAWLDRLLPRIDVEGPAHEPDDDLTQGESPAAEGELSASGAVSR